MGKYNPEYSITSDKRIALNDKAIHIGTGVMSNPSIAQKLCAHCHKCSLLLDPKEAEKLPDSMGCYHSIELLGPDDKLRMGPIYQF